MTVTTALACTLIAAAFAAPDPAAPANPAPAAPTQPAQPAQPAAPRILDLTLKRIDGVDQPLSAYAGQVVVIVNVASRCGFTPQYTALQKLYEQHKDKGLVILGFPSNDFGKQEPGSNKEIAEFCSSTFNVSFPMFEKISVKGNDAHELFKRLAAQPAPVGGEPKWNFTKFVLDRSGNPVARFDSRVKPDSPEMVSKLEELLAQPAPAAATPAQPTPAAKP